MVQLPLIGNDVTFVTKEHHDHAIVRAPVTQAFVSAFITCRTNDRDTDPTAAITGLLQPPACPLDSQGKLLIFSGN